MIPVALYCKSYRGDLERIKVLVESVAKHNIENIPLYISVPRDDFRIFIDNIGNGSRAQIIADEDIVGELPQSWNNQQVVKSSFWKLNLCQNYVCLDSDSYFIRPFYIKDFIVEGSETTDGTVSPYTVMHEQHDLFNWTINKTAQLGFDPIISFKECRQKVMNVFERRGKFYDFGPSPVIWNCAVWKEFENNYLLPNNITFTQLIQLIPSEFTWYGEYLMTTSRYKYPIEPLFKVFHYQGQYIEAKQQGYTEEHYAKLYLGVVMQSNAGIPIKY